VKLSKVPKRIEFLDFEKDILPAEQKIIEKMGFVKAELNFVMTKKPALILFEQDGKSEGLNMLYKYFVEDRNF
jgi:hypothetical protein